MKNTFTRLPKEKQKRIIDAFLMEFKDNDFENASLSKVVETLGIAKGSVYQYFGGKKAVYHSLYELASAKKMHYVQGLDRKDFADFWAWFRALFAAGIQFDLECPLESQFLYRSSQDRSNPEMQEMLASNFKKAIAYFSNIIQAEQDAGKMSREFPSDFIALSITSQSLGIQNYLEHFLQLDLKAHIGESNTVFAHEGEHIFKYIDHSIRMFRQAFSTERI